MPFWESHNKSLPNQQHALDLVIGTAQMTNADIKGSRTQPYDLRVFRPFFELHVHKRKSAPDLLEKHGKNLEGRCRNEPEPDCSCLTALCMKCRCRCLLKSQQDFSCRRQENFACTGDFNLPLWAPKRNNPEFMLKLL